MLGKKLITNKKIRISSLIAVILVAGFVSYNLHVATPNLNESTGKNLVASIPFNTQQASAQNLVAENVPFSVSAPQRDYTIKAGQNIVIPVSVYASGNAVVSTSSTIYGPLPSQSVNQPVGPNQIRVKYPGPAAFEAVKDSVSKISISLDKNTIDLQPSALSSGMTKVDTANLTVSVPSDAKSGMYLILIGLHEGNGMGISRAVYLEIQ